MLRKIVGVASCLIELCGNGIINGTAHYVLNAQGDVVGSINGSCSFAATYTYDPWGKKEV